MRGWSVRARILASMLAVTAIGMVLAGAVTFLVQRERTLEEMDARLLATDLVLVTYVSTIEHRSVRRSSMWRRSGEGWRVVFHQGTRID